MPTHNEKDANDSITKLYLKWDLVQGVNTKHSKKRKSQCVTRLISRLGVTHV